MTNKAEVLIDGRNNTKRAFDEVDRSLNGLATKAADVGKKIGAGRAIGGTALALMTKKSLDAADAIGKQAAAAGISAEKYQELAHAADLAGISQDTFGSGLGAFNKRLGELRAGTGSLNTILGKLGDEGFAKAIKSADSSGAALEILLKKLASIENPADRAALASAAFSRSIGPEMAAALAQGGAEFAKARAEFQKTGNALSNESVVGAEAANDAITKLATAVGNLITGQLIKLAPAIETAADFLTNSLPPAIEAVQLKITDFIAAVAAIPEQVTAAIDAVIAKFEELKTKVLGFVGDTVDGVKDWFGDKLGAIKDFVSGTTEDVTESFESMADDVVMGSIVPDMVDAIIDEFGRLTEGPESILDTTVTANDEMVSAWEQGAEQTISIMEGLGDKLKEIFKGILTGSVSLKDGIKGLFDDLLGGLIDKGVAAAGAAVGRVFAAAFGGSVAAATLTGDAALAEALFAGTTPAAATAGTTAGTTFGATFAAAAPFAVPAALGVAIALEVFSDKPSISEAIRSNWTAIFDEVDLSQPLVGQFERIEEAAGGFEFFRVAGDQVDAFRETLDSLAPQLAAVELGTDKFGNAIVGTNRRIQQGTRDTDSYAT
ncbi:MAG: hypothetical protein ABFS30_07435, partial [Pseudomonadota bacterium]